MLKIRLQRVGRTNNPSFRIVVTESQNATRSGKFLEVLGSFDYREGGADTVHADRVKHWISKGAQSTASVHNYLLGKKIISGKKINVLPRKSPPKKDEPAAAKDSASTAVPAAESPAPAAAPIAEVPKA